MKDMLKKLVSLILVALVTIGTVVAQKPVPPTLSNRVTNPDQVYTNGKDNFYVVLNAANTVLPVEYGSVIQVELKTDFSTKGWKGNHPIAYPMETLNPVFGEYGKYFDGRETVQVEFNARESGYFRRSYIEVRVKSMIVNFPASVVIDKKDGLSVILPPGTYKLSFETQIRNIQYQDRISITLPLNRETTRIPGSYFGNGGQPGICNEVILPTLMSVPKLPTLAYCEGKRFFGFLFKRPNQYLPTGTVLTFHIDRITATRLPIGVSDFETLTPVSNESSKK